MNDPLNVPIVPDSEAHWTALAGRIVVRATTRRNGIGWVGESRVRWAVAAAVVTVAVLLARSPKRVAVDDSRGEWISAFGNRDAAFRAIAFSDHPPAVGGMMLSQTLARSEP